MVPLLKAMSPSFGVSPEYALVAENDDLPGVVLAAFGRFLIRVSATGPRSEVEHGAEAINTLYRWDDSQVRESLRDEFIEAFDGYPVAERAISPFLIPALVEEFSRVLP